MTCPNCGSYHKKRIAVNVAECKGTNTDGSRCGTLYDPRTGKVTSLLQKVRFISDALKDEKWRVSP